MRKKNCRTGRGMYMGWALALIYLVWGMNWVVMKTANLYFPSTQFVAYRFAVGAAGRLRHGLPAAWR